MEKIIDIFQHEFAIRALIASSMVGVMCGILGCFIVLKNMSLIGDALSHAILPGVVAGFLIAGWQCESMGQEALPANTLTQGVCAGVRPWS